MYNLDKGYLITIEGIDGSGKTTFLEKLGPLLKSSFPTVITKEPGDSSLGKQIRKMLQVQNDRNLINQKWTEKAEFLLFAADRAQHMHEVIAPALAQNKLVISDRLADSSIVYQGFVRGLDIELIKNINLWALNNCLPDLTFFIDLDPETAFKRVGHRNKELTAFEREHKEFMKRVEEGYHKLFANKSHVIKLNGNKIAQKLAEEALEHIIKKVVHE